MSSAAEAYDRDVGRYGAQLAAGLIAARRIPAHGVRVVGAR